MKLLLALTGGYKRVMDRVLTLQSETQTFINAQYAALGYDMVLSGCAVTDNGNGTVNIAPGIVFLGGDTLRFDGAANISSNGTMAFVRGGAVTSYPSTFADGSTKNLYSEAKAVIAAQDVDNIYQIKVTTTLYNLQSYIQDQVYQSEVKGTIKEVYDLDGTFLANFDDSGLGVTPRWLNWARDNGNNGTPGSAGMVIIGAGTYTDPVSGQQTVYANGVPLGETKHALTAAENAPHTHTLPSNPTSIEDTGTATYIGLTQNPGKAPGSTGSSGLGTPHNNMQPSMPAYRVVKIK